MPRGTLAGLLRRFLPEYLRRTVLTPAQARAAWAILHCRTPAMGGHLHHCPDCSLRRFLYHSCNHRSCPLCGGADTAAWVARELARRVNVPYFMVTFTLPQPLRAVFAGPGEADAYRVFFAAASQALREVLANPRWLGARHSGFTMVLHTWNQQLHFHPHIHAIVPGTGEAAEGRVGTVKSSAFLVPQPVLRARFRNLIRQLCGHLTAAPGNDHPVWQEDWGVDIRPFGDGANIVRYLGAYVCRTAIGDSRISGFHEDSVTFSWTDRSRGNAKRTLRLTAEQFLARYLRHVAPRGLRTIRRYGFLHPASHKRQQRIAFHTGIALLELDPPADSSPTDHHHPLCPCCGKPMRRVGSIPPAWKTPPSRYLPRAPPRQVA